jgi:hypothetical protein
MEIIAPGADCSYACRVLPNINRFPVNALGNPLPRFSFGTTLAWYPEPRDRPRIADAEVWEPMEDIS